MTPVWYIVLAVGVLCLVLVATEFAHAIRRETVTIEALFDRLDESRNVRPISQLEAARIERDARDALALYAGRDLTNAETEALIAPLNLTAEERARMREVAAARRAEMLRLIAGDDSA